MQSFIWQSNFFSFSHFTQRFFRNDMSDVIRRKMFMFFWFCKFIEYKAKAFKRCAHGKIKEAKILLQNMYIHKLLSKECMVIKTRSARRAFSFLHWIFTWIFSMNNLKLQFFLVCSCIMLFLDTFVGTTTQSSRRTRPMHSNIPIRIVQLFILLRLCFGFMFKGNLYFFRSLIMQFSWDFQRNDKGEKNFFHFLLHYWWEDFIEKAFNLWHHYV